MLQTLVKQRLNDGRLRLQRTRRDTREEILNAAEELLQRRGYNAFSYQHIAVQLGIRNAAIHYHFPGKEDLGVALIRRFRQSFRDWAETVATQEADAWCRLQALFETYAEYLSLDNMRICPVGVLGSEFEAIPEPMRHETRLLLREHYEFLIDTLTLGRDQGTLVFSGEPRAKAVEVAAVLQGGVQIARMAGLMRFRQILGQLSLNLRPQLALGSPDFGLV